MTPEFELALAWIASLAVALIVQLDHGDASFFAGAYHPVGNDSFYHARRILDTASDPSSFYEFDPKIHAPDGSLVTWPWGYDYAVAWLVRGIAQIVPSTDPLAVLAHIPTAAVIGSVSLVLAIAVMLGLPIVYVLLAGIATGLLPLTQQLHGVGNIDQHYAEYMAILGALGAGMAWLRQGSRPALAALTGAVLGIAPAMHSALFIIQIPLLTTIGLLWLKGRSLPIRDTIAFGVALMLTTLAVLIPSEPVRLGLFEYYRLSWFQLYIAACSAAILIFLSIRPPNLRSVLLLAVVAAFLCLPVIPSLQHANSFFSREITMNRTLQETQSVWELASGPGGLRRAVGYYSGFLLVLPVSILICLVGAWRCSNGARVLFYVFCLFGAPLLLTQVRLHYFGSFALYVPPLIAAAAMSSQVPRASKPVLIASMALLVASYWIPVKDRLFVRNMPANDIYYSFSSMAMRVLADACKSDPGIALAGNNDGHYIRFHTDCSVISNNFLVTREDEEKARQTTRLLGMTPDQLLESAVPVNYVLARASGLVISIGDGRYELASQDMAASVTGPLFSRLLWSAPETVGSRWQLVQEWKTPGDDSYVFMRVWKVRPAPEKTAGL